MKVYKAEEVEKFRDSATSSLTYNFLCTIKPRIYDRDGYKIAYYDFDDKKWYGDEAVAPVLDVKYFTELPCTGEFNDAIAEIERRCK